MTFKEFLELGQVEVGINPNCSEATIRVRTDGVPDEKVKKLMEHLQRKFEESQEPPKTGDWDDQLTSEDDLWSEGYLNWTSIFGVNVLEITGDAPFNYGDEITDVIKQYIPDADIEYKE